MPQNKKRVNGKAKVLTNKDRAKIEAAYDKKFEEYSEMSLEELKELQKSNLETKLIRGTYLKALDNSILVKERAALMEKITPAENLTEV